MNSIDVFLKSMLPSVPIEEIINRVHRIDRTLKEETIPSLEATVSILRNRLLSDPFLKKLDLQIKKELKIKMPMLEQIDRIVKFQTKNIESILKELESHPNRTIARSSITYTTLQVMRVIDAVSFVSDYTRSLLIYTIAVETSVIRKNGRQEDLRLSPAQIDRLKNGVNEYVYLLKALDTREYNLSRQLEKMPRIQVDPDNLMEQFNMMGRKELDPTGLVTDGFILQTVLPVRRMYADWQEARRQAAIEERRLLEYQILDMKAALDGTNDIKVQKHLEYSEKRMRELNHKIQIMEDV